ncbi:hypothetical protein LUZ60_003468 [Juncus effusus]|nr:hypothetical protein LUZ60_003468 [Juncus effusus]
MEGFLGRKKAMWVYPKVLGFNPPERWGHSACYFDGVLYVFGGCCGGLHFSDILTLNLETMVWTSLVTTGAKPGTRDSHAAVTIGTKMYVFGGTNGSKKVNELHILDLRTTEWSKPNTKGALPSPRESHSMTVVNEGKIVIFGGSGEGEANYLNDVYVLDVKSLSWSRPEVKGEVPAKRDSHVSVCVGSKMFIFGGDCGDRYHGEVDVLDIDTMTWSTLTTQGASPGVRAGHAAVAVGSKVYVIGGVGDKQYYSDVWVLDVSNRTWSQLEICGQPPQGRFAHTAVVTSNDIAIYGGCGEDERPLNELLILQLGSDHPNSRNNISVCKSVGGHWSQEMRKFLRSENVHRGEIVKNGEIIQRASTIVSEVRSPPYRELVRSYQNRGLDNVNAKRRKTAEAKTEETEQEEHSLTISQHSSPSQSDQEPNIHCKISTSPNGLTRSGPQPFVPVKLHHKEENSFGHPKHTQEIPFLRSESPKHCVKMREVQFLPADQKMLHRPALGPQIIGAEVHGTVDGAFDSGYLMTALVNGQIFRGVLFAPGPGVMGPRPVIHPQILPGSTISPHQHHGSRHQHHPSVPIHARSALHSTSPVSVRPNWGHQFTRQTNSSQILKANKTERIGNDLSDVVLTLGGPGN